MKYKVKFTGRKLGAVGVMQKFEVEVEADTRHDARMLVYDDFQDIAQATMQELPNGEEINFFGSGAN